MELYFLQHYWWILISILAGALVFLLFVQGGQSLLYTLAKNSDERDLLINTLGHKWEFTFTTLVVFGGAFFASFPLFYSTSFGGAYIVWMLILFSFVIQAVSFEYRKKPNNFLGQRTFEIFLIINGYAAPLLIGAAVATFFTGSPFQLGEMNDVIWMTPWRGLDALFIFTNYLLAFSVFFLSRVLACLYFITTIDNTAIQERSQKHLRFYTLFFLIFFLGFLGSIFSTQGFGTNETGQMALIPFKYFHNLVEMPINTIILLAGICGVLFGIIRTWLHQEWRKGIWFTGAGTMLTVFALFILAGFNHTSFYPSSTDLASSLTIYNASSSHYTLETMSWVSLFIPFIIAYIWYAWRSLTKKPMTEQDLEEQEHRY